MAHFFIFGMGYTASYLADALRKAGWSVAGTGRNGEVSFTDSDAILDHIARADAILSSVPPDRTTGDDPVLARYGEALRHADLRWSGYLSSTGVYGDVAGAWVDENAPIGHGRRTARAAADSAWQGLRNDMRVFRLPGIYGPGRNVLSRIRAGTAKRIHPYRNDGTIQSFSRCHVADIVSGVMVSFDKPPGVYNLADDAPCPQADVIAYGCALLGMSVPPLQSLEEAQLSAQARKFYAENRKIANGKAKRILGWKPHYPDYQAGLSAIAVAMNEDDD